MCVWVSEYLCVDVSECSLSKQDSAQLPVFPFSCSFPICQWLSVSVRSPGLLWPCSSCSWSCCCCSCFCLCHSFFMRKSCCIIKSVRCVRMMWLLPLLLLSTALAVVAGFSVSPFSISLLHLLSFFWPELCSVAFHFYSLEFMAFNVDFVWYFLCVFK